MVRSKNFLLWFVERRQNALFYYYLCSRSKTPNSKNIINNNNNKMILLIYTTKYKDKIHVNIMQGYVFLIQLVLTICAFYFSNPIEWFVSCLMPQVIMRAFNLSALVATCYAAGYSFLFFSICFFFFLLYFLLFARHHQHQQQQNTFWFLNIIWCRNVRIAHL